MHVDYTVDSQIIIAQLAKQIASALWVLLQASEMMNENEIYITCQYVLTESLADIELVEYERIADLLLADRKIARKLIVAFLRRES
jgi:hypothetical protein